MATADFIAERVKGAAPSLFAQLTREAQALEKEGQKVTYLLLGEPDFTTPAHIIEAAKAAMDRGLTHYAPAEGTLELRRAIAAKHAQEQGMHVDPEREVIVTTGAQMGLYLAFMCTLNPGDEVILTEPFYGPYAPMISYCGATSKYLQLENRGGHFTLRPDVLRAATTPRTKAIVVNTPSNPTGSVFAADELRGIAEVAIERNLLVITDECYDALLYDGRRHVSIASLGQEIREHTILVNSFSKRYAMTGWRIGYNIAPPALSQAMQALHLRSGRCASPFTQAAATVALEGPQDCVAEMRAAYAARRELVIAGLNEIPGIVAPAPEGTFYAFVDASRLGMDSLSLARHILKTGGVCLVPGREFGPSVDSFVRLSFAASNEQLQAGIAGIARAVEALGVTL